MVMWYWSADTLFLQVSIGHDMDYQYQVCYKPRQNVSFNLLAGEWPPFLGNSIPSLPGEVEGQI